MGTDLSSEETGAEPDASERLVRGSGLDLGRGVEAGN